MPRARNIKHSFFTNDELAENHPLGRILFIGLWTLADYKGGLEWRPKKIKSQLLPYDNCDIEELAINLDKSGFIRFYSDGESVYVRIVNFSKHQNPHKNERDKGSEIPDYCEKYRQLIDLKELAINRDKSGLNQEDSASDPADSLSLIPDSGFHNPDSGAPKKNVPATGKKSKRVTDTSETWAAYSNAYHARYHVDPTRNKTVNSQMANFCKRVPIEEAPHIAAFYVNHNNSFYAAKLHPIGLMLADAEKLRTEWATNRQMTQTGARQIDQRQTNLSNVDEAIRLMEAKEAAKNGKQ